MIDAEYNLISNLAILRVANDALRGVFFYEQPEREAKLKLATRAVRELIDELYAEYDAAKERA